MKSTLHIVWAVCLLASTCYGEAVTFDFANARKSMEKSREKLYINVLDKLTIPLSEELGDVSFECICDLDILNFKRGSWLLVSVGGLQTKIACTDGGRTYKIGTLKLENRDQYKKVTLVLRYCAFTRSTCVLVKSGEEILQKTPWEKKYVKQRFGNFSVGTRASTTREGGKKTRNAAMAREIPENTTGNTVELQEDTIVCYRGYRPEKKRGKKGSGKDAGDQAVRPERERNLEFKVTPIAINVVDYGFGDRLRE